jgi:hypothetical protein
MQKALDQMNLQIHHVISDITGLIGLRIVDAILAGQRDPKKLADLRDGRIRASEELSGKRSSGTTDGNTGSPSNNRWLPGATIRS